MSELSTKDKFIEAAIELFSEKGYDGTGVDELASFIGLKGPNLYQYFKGKDALLEEACLKVDQEYAQAMGLMNEEGNKIITSADLRRFVKSQIDHTLSNERFRKMRKLITIEQYRNEALAERATKYQLSNMVDFYTVIFRRMMDSGRIEDGNPEQLAFEFISPITVLIQLLDRRSESEDEVRNRVDRHIDFFIGKYVTDREG